jgi:Kef-type K+ transport system membrane component KefB
MIDSFPPLALAVLVIGAVTLLATLGHAGLARFGLPDVIDYLLIGRQ